MDYYCEEMLDCFQELVITQIHNTNPDGFQIIWQPVDRTLTGR